jgi:microcompartment protein CcmL/EutN
MVKRAEVDVVQAGTVQPGNLLVLLGGPVAEVEEALKAGLTVAADMLTDHIFLPAVASQVVRAMAGQRDIKALELASTALGIVETHTVPAAIQAADAGVKGAEITLMEVRLADGLGGKGLVFFTGQVSGAGHHRQRAERRTENPAGGYPAASWGHRRNHQPQHSLRGSVGMALLP